MHARVQEATASNGYHPFGTEDQARASWAAEGHIALHEPGAIYLHPLRTLLGSLR